MNRRHLPVIRRCPWWLRLTLHRPDATTTAIISGNEHRGWRIDSRCTSIHRHREHNYLVDLRTHITETSVSTAPRVPGELTLVIVWWVTAPLLSFLHNHHDIERHLIAFVRAAVHEVLHYAENHDDILAVRHRVATIFRRVRTTGIGVHWYALNVRAHRPQPPAER